MKPPPRKRIKREYELKEGASYSCRLLCKWPKGELTKLLTALRNMSTNKSTSPGLPPDLDPEHLRKELDTRSTEEIHSVLETLKTKIILFAKNKLNTERRSERRGQIPIELWTHVASAVTGGAEEALSSAFSQMFLVTSTEPCTVRNNALAPNHSPATTLNEGNPPPSIALVLPPSPAMGPQSQVNFNKTLPSPQGQPDRPNHPTAAGTSSQSAANKRLPYVDEEVSFERIYQYFSVLHKPNKCCRLTPMESAIVLDLLMSLPEELLLLDCNKLVNHLTQVYQYLSSHANSKMANSKMHNFFKDVQGQQQPAEQGHKQHSEILSHSQVNWTLHPPINPYLIPVSLLTRKATSEANQT